MRELERESHHPDLTRLRCAIVGAGRLGHALAAALRDRGVAVDGPLGRGADGLGTDADGVATNGAAASADVVLLCVPDAEIATAAKAIAPGPLVGHCSGATPLAALAPHEAFSLHPLMTVPATGPTRFAGATAAIAGTTARAHATANALAHELGLTPVTIAEHDRAAYHAAASIASNFLVTLEAAAERLAATTSLDRAALVPLVQATVENWAKLGPQEALTGPVARGDEATVTRQREAIQQRTPDLLPLFDALTTATRTLALRTDDADRAGGAGEDAAAGSAAAALHPATGPARSHAEVPA